MTATGANGMGAANLIGGLAPLLDQWLPDETLFSLASRHHVVTGNVRPGDTCMQLFGHKRLGSAHDLPARVDEFVRRTAGLLGDAEHVIYRHTMLPFFLRLRRQADAANAIACVRAGGIGGLKGRLGLLAGRFGAANPLKACSLCIAADEAEHSVAYWHLDHQWPSTWLCVRHDQPLFFALAKTNGRGRFEWFLPAQVSLVEGVAADHFDQGRSTLRQLAKFGSAFASMPSGIVLVPDALTSTYRARMSELGVAGPTGRVRIPAFMQLIDEYCRVFRNVPTLEVLANSVGPVGHHFLPLVRSHRATAHPIKHLVLGAALFGEWDAFMVTYERQLNAANTWREHVLDTRTPSATVAVADANNVRLVAAIESGASVTSAAKGSGVSVATAQAWAANAGLCTARRPKKLLPDTRTRAIRMLLRGAEKAKVATASRVSIQTITHLLRTVPGLHARWADAKFLKARQAARKHWEAAAGRLAAPTANLLREVRPATFAWLYRNDRAWLQSFATGLHHPPRSNHVTVRWDDRDEDLSQRILEVGMQWYADHPSQRLRLSHLCDSVPSLKGRLSKLDRIPLTRTAIRTVLHHRPT